MLHLPDVTLIVVETRCHELCRLAINDFAAKEITFARTVIYTDKPDAFGGIDADYIGVPNWPNKTAQGHFYYQEAAMITDTSHALLMEWDAGPRSPEMWDPAFLNYDWIGAPWPGQRYGGWTPIPGFTVGNGGFALISRKLARYIWANKHRQDIYADYHVCKDYRPDFERNAGAVWAPEEVAYRFAFEHGDPVQTQKPSFGYHDVFNWPLALSKDELMRRVQMLMANDYVVRHTPKLILLGNQAQWLFDELPGFREAVNSFRGRDVRVPANQPKPPSTLRPRPRLPIMRPLIGSRFRQGVKA